MCQQNLSWLVSLALAALFAIPNAAGRYHAGTRIIVSFDIAVVENINRPPAVQLYYDQGKGFTEKHSIRVVLPERAISKKFQAFLPATSLHGLRLDYLNGPGTVTLSRLSLVDPYGTPLAAPFKASDFSLNQTQAVQQSDDTLTVRSDPQADDPFLSLSFDPPLKARSTGKIWPNILFGIKIFVIFSLFMEMVFLIIGRSWINDWMKKRKRTQSDRAKTRETPP